MTNWQTKKLGDVMDFVPTGAHSRNDMTSATDNPNQVFNIHYGDIHTKYFTYVNLDKDTVPVLIENTVRDNMRLQDGDLVVADASEDYDGVGSSVELRNVRNRKVIGGLHTFALRSKNDEFAPGFAGIMLKNPATHKRLMQMSVYSKVYGLTKSSIASVDINYPEKPEQERIVGVLEVWNEYIEKLEQKIALKEQLKIALMQQIFSRKRRLQGFTARWREVRLEEVAVVERGKPLTSNQLIPGNYPVIAGGKTSPYRHSEYTHEDVITVSASGANAGYVAYQARKIWASDSSVVYGRNSEYLTLYIYYWLHFMQDRIYNLQTGGAQPHVQPPDLRRFKILIPEKDEQFEIVAILGAVDLEINYLERLKKQIGEQKKYLLKNLITGTIRTPETLSISKGAGL